MGPTATDCSRCLDGVGRRVQVCRRPRAPVCQFWTKADQNRDRPPALGLSVKCLQQCNNSISSSSTPYPLGQRPLVLTTSSAPLASEDVPFDQSILSSRTTADLHRPPIQATAADTGIGWRILSPLLENSKSVFARRASASPAVAPRRGGQTAGTTIRSSHLADSSR